MNILIVGAKSDIAKECAREFAKNGFDLILLARDVLELEDFKKDITIRYEVDVDLIEFDVLDFNSFENIYKSLNKDIEIVLTALGYMNEQKICERDFLESLKTINTNYTGLVAVLNIVANDFESKEKGAIIGISSVAGDRGRKANYIYGSSKAAFSSYLSGLRNRLFEKNVSVITVKPGFVYTKMTKDLDLPPKLTAKPNEVAKDIFKAYKNKKDIVYTKPIWKIIMLIIKMIPETIFKRLSI